ncbi:MAG: hypothetical protein AAF628_30820 [Planctomycetota bacterium]
MLETRLSLRAFVVLTLVGGSILGGKAASQEQETATAASHQFDFWLGA